MHNFICTQTLCINFRTVHAKGEKLRTKLCRRTDGRPTMAIPVYPPPLRCGGITSNSSFPTVFSTHLENFLPFYQIWNCLLQTLSVWKSPKFVVWERINLTYIIVLLQDLKTVILLFTSIIMSVHICMLPIFDLHNKKSYYLIIILKPARCYKPTMFTFENIFEKGVNDCC